MKISIDIKGLKELQSGLKDFSDRRMKAVVATALTRTAKAVKEDWGGRLGREVDRPTPLTMNAVRMKGATASDLQVEIMLKDKGLQRGLAPSQYLQPQVYGGGRLLKRFEDALVKSGAMPQGYVTVPGKHATLDGYGNISRAQLIAVIRALGKDYSPGYQRTISKSTAKRLQAMAKHGRQYVAVSPQDARKAKVSPGIYERMADGSRKAIFLFKRSVSYKSRLSLMERSSVAAIQARAQGELDRALTESLARLAQKRVN